MTRKIAVLQYAALITLLLGALLTPTANAQSHMQIYGAWQCYTDGCSWPQSQT